MRIFEGITGNRKVPAASEAQAGLPAAREARQGRSTSEHSGLGRIGGARLRPMAQSRHRALQGGGLALGVILVMLIASAGTMREHAPFTSAKAAFAVGEKALIQNRPAEALAALTFAANSGVLGAQIRLARLYRGKGPFTIPASPEKSLHYYRMIADENADIDRAHPAAPAVAEAFREIAAACLSGKVPGIARNPHRAAGFLSEAASHFGDARAQYQLARLYLSGTGVPKNPPQAARWLVNAARKRYAPAQAMLGRMLWAGKGVPRGRAQGLALLAIAADDTSAPGSGRIGAAYRLIRDLARREDQAQAERLLARWAGTLLPVAALKRVQHSLARPSAVPEPLAVEAADVRGPKQGPQLLTPSLAPGALRANSVAAPAMPAAAPAAGLAIRPVLPAASEADAPPEPRAVPNPGANPLLPPAVIPAQTASSIQTGT